MTIRHLRVFISVCEQGNMTKAAKALHVAQPAVSYTVAEIEKHYGVKLFERIKQRLILTDFGKELLVKARECVSSFEAFEQLAFRGAGESAVKIGASITIGKTVVPNYLEKLRGLYPQIAPFVTINKSSVIEQLVVSGQLDFAIIEGKPSISSVSAEELSGDRLIAVCKRELNIPKSCYAEELLKFPLLLREWGSVSRELLENLFTSRGYKLNPFVESSSNDALVTAAKSGLGVVILPSVLMESLLEDGQFMEIEIKDAELLRKYYLIKNPSRKLSEQAELLSRIFVDEIKLKS